MNTRKLLRRSLYHYRKNHLWVVLGTAVSTAILVGALIIGDSVRFSLEKIVRDRLGATDMVMTSGDRFFRTRLADNLASHLQTTVAPLLLTRGIAIAEGGRRRVNHVQVLGADSRFGEVGGVPGVYDSLASGEVVINRPLAERLDLSVGDELLLRIQRLDFMPQDTPLALETDSALARRFTIKTVAADDQFGRFNLNADQVAPFTAVVSLSTLSGFMDLDDRANVLLIAERQVAALDKLSVTRALAAAWTIADAGLKVYAIPGQDAVELRSNRVFLTSPAVTAAMRVDDRARPILTYFINEFRHEPEGYSTPYSFVSAPGFPIVPLEMKDDEIIINAWLAEDLQVNIGDELRLSYYILGKNQSLIEADSVFRVREVVPLQGMYADKSLLPDFPGLAEIEHSRDWNPGIPIDLDRIRDKDEDYWHTHRGTPKAFVTLAAAQSLWGNRFGNLTAIRYPDMQKSQVEEKLEQELDPEKLGFLVREVKKEGLAASSQSVDFGQLFLGLSFFIILAALLLTGLLFVFNVESRSEEHGLLLALGFSRWAVRRFILYEGAVLILLGSFLGGIAGIFYNQVILLALRTVWHGVVGTSALNLHVKPLTILMGTAIGMVIAFFSIWAMARKQVKQPVSGLQKGLIKIDAPRMRTPRVSLLLGIISVIAVGIILALTDFNRGREAFSFFFIAGSLLLVGGTAFTHVFLFRLGKRIKTERLGLLRIGVRGAVRRRARSLTLITLLAIGLFIVFTVGANRRSSIQHAEKRASGTGGFTLLGESSLPILYDLDSKKGRQYYALERIQAEDVDFVQFRVKAGDDASCLNLNRVSNPQVLGVDPEELSGRKAFTFVDMTDDLDPQNPWSGLNQTLPDGSIPAVADHTVIVWGLGKSVGDTLNYQDEYGEEFKIKLVGGLANSIFQGNIIISEEAFLKRYPSLSGYRFFLLDTPADTRDAVAEDVSWAMQDQGMDLVSTTERLADFNKVENTYLSIFLILGSFGLVLGSIGIGIVVWRNINERQGELALLRAVGFQRNSLLVLVLSEHFMLLSIGVIFGVLAALLATLPALLTPGSEVPYLTLFILLLLVLSNGVIWTYAATALATKKDLLPALRSE